MTMNEMTLWGLDLLAWLVVWGTLTALIGAPFLVMIAVIREWWLGR